MRHLKFTLFFLLMTVFLPSTSFAQKEGKIGYVNLSTIFDEYHKTKEYDTVLEGEHKSFETERNAKIEKIKEAQGRLGLLKEDKKAELEAEIEKMKTELLEYDRQRKTDLTKNRNEKIQEILLEIEKVVSEYAQKEGYAVILNDRVLIYGNKAIDLTDQILKTLNANTQKK